MHDPWSLNAQRCLVARNAESEHQATPIDAIDAMQPEWRIDRVGRGRKLTLIPKITARLRRTEILFCLAYLDALESVVYIRQGN